MKGSDEVRLGEKVFYLLKEQGRQQKELADAIGSKPSTVQGWRQENRNPTSELIMPICEFFKITPNVLFECGDIPEGLVQLSDDESDLIEIYRRVDRKGKTAIMSVADHEDDRVRLKGGIGESAAGSDS